MSDSSVPAPLADFPTASLKVIDIQKLQDQVATEYEKLLSAAKEEGFFYLDFSNMPDWLHFSNVVGGVYDLEKELFDLSEEEKLSFDVDKHGPMKLNGYKPIGRNVGGVGGKRDGFESWAIPKDGVLPPSMNIRPFSRPVLLHNTQPLLATFMKYMDIFTTTIHTALSTAMGLQGSERLELFHRSASPSPSILRLLKYHAQPTTERGASQTPHTDLGSLTLLFTRQPGLQVLPRGAKAAPESWRFVMPKPGCAIVNIGDGLAMMTGGLLTSSLHRVGPLPGQAMGTRYSFAYLQRAEEHTILKVPQQQMSVEEEITSGEWLRRKFGMLRKDTYAEDTQWILTGRQDVAPV
ncbi:Clavaminate synthase-like protein [Delitschia confertaspora ATCC 74209]|uniref:Clavaminate synthase-like protein n=1 Tax=Delitschia confertaspora ATCC 74209 TaxID=1513339 RepID=A0A9P4MXI9_9PLEO|nr:Clavaminate synthase-like protein [Delitschia confertaspora ATCC 74209]